MRSFSDLPEEIIVNIVSRLPAKCVGRCRCISKSWRALLSRPDFIRTHLHVSRSLQQESLFLISEHTKVWNCISYASLSSAHHLFDEITVSAKKLRFAGVPRCWSWIYGSCDGLLLVGNWDDDLFVLNPITREIRKVPDSPFALDPLERFITYGFGYDSVSDDYKIVAIYCHCDDYEEEEGKEEEEDDDDDCTKMFVDVYSLKTDSWEKAESSPYDHFSCQFTSGVFVDGCIHWLASRNTDGRPTIVVFDLAQEKFREVPPPSSIRGIKCLFDYFLVRGSGCLVVLGSRLCTFYQRQDGVWVMEEYGMEDRWTELQIYDPEADIIDEIRPLCMLGQERMVLKDIEKLLVYNLEERTMEDVDVRGIQLNVLDAASFVETLVSPHGTPERGRD